MILAREVVVGHMRFSMILSLKEPECDALKKAERTKENGNQSVRLASSSSECDRRQQDRSARPGWVGYCSGPVLY
jgi:hypothetical protein